MLTLKLFSAMNILHSRFSLEYFLDGMKEIRRPHRWSCCLPRSSACFCSCHHGADRSQGLSLFDHKEKVRGDPGRTSEKIKRRNRPEIR